MKKIIYISFYFGVIFLLGCENEENITTDDVFKEQIVIHSEIHPFENFSGVRVTRTLPIGTTFSIELAEIKNANIYLKIDEVQIVPLHYDSNGIYMPMYDFEVEENQKYELFGEVNEQSFYSHTIIPRKPVVNSTAYNSFNHFAEAEINAFGDEVYSALWVVYSGSFKTSEYFFDVVKAEDNSVPSVHVRSAEYPEQYQSSAYQGLRYIQVCSFDKSFENYFKTFGNAGTINNPYVQGTGITIWNVQGNDVIGMFIGVAKGDIVWVN